MQPLADALGKDVEVRMASTVDAATELLADLMRPGDAVLVKASNSIGLAKLVEAVKGRVPCST
jgi:UDP-N-acetylmuramyl pentapeptide synthase